MVWRNLWRNRRRTLITMASITFAVLLAILMQSLQKGIFDNLVKKTSQLYHGYVQIHKKGYWSEQVLDNSFAMNESLVNELKKNKHISEVVPTYRNICVGIGEQYYQRLYGSWHRTCQRRLSYPPKKQSYSWRIFAKQRHCRLNCRRLGKTPKYIAQRYHWYCWGRAIRGLWQQPSLKLKALDFGSPALNDGLVHLPLATAQNFLSAENMLTSMALAIDKPENMEMIQKSAIGIMGSSYEVMNWKELMPEIANHIKADGVSFYLHGYFILYYCFWYFWYHINDDRRTTTRIWNADCHWYEKKQTWANVNGRNFFNCYIRRTLGYCN